MNILGIHHIALITGRYAESKIFYTDVLGFTVLRETYRKERHSYKLDLSLNGQYTLELFTFPDAPDRPSFPETKGLRHLAFAVSDVDAAAATLKVHGIDVQPIRIDELTGKRFIFFEDPDGQPLEFYER
jgi:glyoxylase I family protein